MAGYYFCIVLLCAVRLHALKDSASVSLSANLCSNSSDCYPVGLNGSSVPTKYINCSDQKCVCSDCFYATNSYRSCAYQRCWEYDNTTQTCNDLRKDQRTAFFLSFFLSALGAANFYIEQDVLGGIQLIILFGLPFVLLLMCFLLVLLLIFIKACCTSCCEICCSRCDDGDIVWWPCLLLLCLWLLLIAMWWVADLVTFAENLRVSGDGCPLKQDL